MTIIGYASPGRRLGPHNLALSAKRARAVRARLISLGVLAYSIGKAVGRVPPVSRAPPARHGHLDEDLRRPAPRTDHPSLCPGSHLLTGQACR